MHIYPHTAGNRTPYTYLIGWSKLNRWYYGVRFAKDCKPDELWKTYFTSSKYVKTFREENGEPDVIQVRKRFNDIKQAIKWEESVIRRLKMHKRTEFLNKACGGCISIDDEVRQKISKALKGKPKSEEFKQKLRGRKRPESVIEILRQPRSEKTKQKIRESRLGKKHSEETLQKLRGHKHSEETCSKIRAKALGRKISEGARQKLSEKNKGENNPMSAKNRSLRNV